MTRFFALLLLSIISTNTQALESFSGKIVRIEATYMPNNIQFTLDSGNSSCPAGKTIVWQKEPENNKVIYATVMAALISGTKVLVYINNGDTSCLGQFIYILSN